MFLSGFEPLAFRLGVSRYDSILGKMCVNLAKIPVFTNFTFHFI